MEYTVNIPLQAIEEKIGQTLDEISSLLKAVDITANITKKDLRATCPNCSKDNKDTKEQSLSIYIKDGIKWKCHKCDLSKKKFNNLIGLMRAFNEITPWEAVNKLFDEAFKNDSKSKTTFPLNIENFKHKKLHEIPPHKLYWLLIAGNAEIITQDLKDEITARLYDVAPF